MNTQSVLIGSLLLIAAVAACRNGRESVGRDAATDTQRPAGDATGEGSQGGGATVAAPKEETAATPAAPSGMNFQSSGKPTSIEEINKGVTPMTQAELDRYARVAVALVTAINAEDRAAYRELHTDEGWRTAIDWWQNMFAMQTSKFGRIDRAWPPTRGVVRVGGLGFRGNEGDAGATVMVRFEDGVGGALTFVLDEHDKIASTSVFIKEELGHYAPDGVQPIYPTADSD